MDLEKGEGTAYVRAGDDLSYGATNTSGYGRNVLFNFNCKEAVGAITKYQIIFFVFCVVLFALGIISLFDGLLGIILGVLTILLAIFGIVGGFLAIRILMIVYLVGVGLLLAFTIVGLVFDIITISLFGLIVGVIMTVFYVASGISGFIVLLKCK